jgi:uncharacterized protein
MRSVVALMITAILGMAASADDKKPLRLLLVTHSGGFIHDSVGVAEDVLKDISPKYGYTLTTYRYTGDLADPGFSKYAESFRARTQKPVEKEHCGRINASTLKNFDVVLFFTTGSGPKKKNIGPLTESELADLTAWVKAGGAFCGTHCASDTMYDSTYGELIGGYFKTHPHQQKVKLKLEDPKHPAAAGMSDNMDWMDEYYVFTDKPYSRDKLHIILSIDKSTFDAGKNKNALRDDGDYAVSWCKAEGQGKVFYTSLGHRQDVWKSENFQKHLMGGLDWSVGRAKGDSTPTKK